MARKLTDADRAAGIRTLARMLDSAVKIPGTGIRFGAESVFGLIPVVGDIAGAALSGYIVLASARLGAPASTIVRMMVNIGIGTSSCSTVIWLARPARKRRIAGLLLQFFLRCCFSQLARSG